MGDKKELSEEKKAKVIKYVTVDEWKTLFALIRDLSTMVFEVAKKVDELESRTIGVTNPVKLEGVQMSEIAPKGDNNEE